MKLSIDKIVKIEHPFPHIYTDNFLEGTLREELRHTFETEIFTTATGGCPVSNIRKGSNTCLLSFKDKVVLKGLVPQLDEIFAVEIKEKQKELGELQQATPIRNNAKFGYFHLTRNLPGTSINFHRDDERASYQFVFFLGDCCDKDIYTTELLMVDDSKNVEFSGDFSGYESTTWEETKNGFLCFANTPVAYHGLSKKIKSERFTIAGSVIHYDCI